MSSPWGSTPKVDTSWQAGCPFLPNEEDRYRQGIHVSEGIRDFFSCMRGGAHVSVFGFQNPDPVSCLGAFSSVVRAKFLNDHEARCRVLRFRRCETDPFVLPWVPKPAYLRLLAQQGRLPQQQDSFIHRTSHQTSGKTATHGEEGYVASEKDIARDVACRLMEQIKREKALRGTIGVHSYYYASPQKQEAQHKQQQSCTTDEAARSSIHAPLGVPHDTPVHPASFEAFKLAQRESGGHQHQHHQSADVGGASVTTTGNALSSQAAGMLEEHCRQIDRGRVEPAAGSRAGPDHWRCPLEASSCLDWLDSINRRLEGLELLGQKAARMIVLSQTTAASDR